FRVAGLGRRPPSDALALVEANQEPHLGVFALAERPPAFPAARPGDVSGALPVAGLATDAHLRPRAGEAVVRRVVVLAHAGRVALGAHEIPVLVQLRPMQDVVVLDLLIRIEMEPALAALILGPSVPGD